MAFVSYAQNFEDVILWRALKDIDNGFYIDVGAYDAQADSVTKAFYDRGWCGVNVEPIESLFRKLENERPRDVNLQLAVGSDNGSVTIYEVANTGLSTTEAEIATKHRETGYQVSEALVQRTSLSNIFQSHVRSDVHFLKIDVEGGTKAVIEGLDFKVNRPWIIVVEATLPASQVPDFEDWDGIILSGGYDFVYFDGLNRFYLAHEQRRLLSRFQTPPNVFDEFEVIGSVAVKARLQEFERASNSERDSLKQSVQLESERARVANERAREAVERERQATERAQDAGERASQAAENARQAIERAREVTAHVGRVESESRQLQRTLDERDEVIRTFQGDMDRLKAYGNKLERSAAEQFKQIREVQSHASRAQSAEFRLDQEVEFSAALSSRLEEREELLRTVYDSRSWRITAPLRALSASLLHRKSQVEASPLKPTIFVECTHTYHSDLNTGIQRVVRNILRNAPVIAQQYGYEVVPVIIEGGRFQCVSAERVLADKQYEISRDAAAPGGATADTIAPPVSYLRHTLRPVWRAALATVAWAVPRESVRRFLYSPPQQPGLAHSIAAVIRRLREGKKDPVAAPKFAGTLDDFARCDGSILLLLDSSWTIPIWPATRRFKQHGGSVVGVIYDLIPITHSHTSVPELSTAFGIWLAEHFQLTEGFVCISRSIAEMLADYINKTSNNAALASHAKIRHFHLGSELDFISSTSRVRPAIADIFEPERHAFLMVGSIEPRKMHAYALEAFDLFWQRGGKAALVIVGRNSWKTEDLLNRIANHPQLGHQLFILRDASDAELDYCYKNASSLVIASEIEGFGLPVVEAFQRGLPVICSDIPVFREIADGKATFFDLSDPINLAHELDQFCLSIDLRDRRQRKPQAWISWRQSTEQLLAAVMDIRKRLIA